MPDSVPDDHARRADLDAFHAEDWMLAEEMPIEDYGARQPGPAPSQSRDGRVRRADVSRACGETLESGRHWAFLDAGGITARHELERARNAVNKKAYVDFVAHNSADPEFRGKFVAFVHGKFGGSDRSRSDLIRRMRGKFGNVCMYVGRSSGVTDVLAATPKVLRQE